MVQKTILNKVQIRNRNNVIFFFIFTFIFILGRFVDLDAEDAERLVDKYYTAINKAAKFFSKAELKEQR